MHPQTTSPSRWPTADRPVVGSYPTYDDAQRAVDFLSDTQLSWSQDS